MLSLYGCNVIRYPLSVIRYPLSVIRYPLSVIRYPLSVIRYPLSVRKLSLYRAESQAPIQVFSVTSPTFHSSLVTRHSSLVTRHSSLVTRHSSLVTSPSADRYSGHHAKRKAQKVSLGKNVPLFPITSQRAKRPSVRENQCQQWAKNTAGLKHDSRIKTINRIC
jgi:hypothetical protein